jgi:hypothetical protein
VDVGAIDEHGARAVEGAVHGARETCGDRLHPAGEIPCAGRLDDDVQMIALDRVVDEPEAPALARPVPASLKLGYEPTDPQIRHVVSHLQGDVTGVPRRERCPPTVRVARLRSGLAPGSGSGTAPARRRHEVERELCGS